MIVCEVHTQHAVHRFSNFHDADEFIETHFQPEVDDDLWLMTNELGDWFGGDYFSTGRQIIH
jgi:hypothetical protein